MTPVDPEQGGSISRKPKAPNFPSKADRLLYNQKKVLLANVKGNPDSIPLASEVNVGLLSEWDYNEICNLFGRVCAIEQELGMKVGINCNSGVMETPEEAG